MESFWARFDYSVKVRLPIVLGVALLTVVVTALVTAPVRRAVGYAPAQPVNFSHKLHAGDMKVDCRYCHIGAETGRFAAVPATGICMNCHRVAVVDRPGVAAVRRSFQQGTPIAWKRIHRLPDFTYFAHDVHLAAKADCRDCHGDVASMDVLRQVKSLSMGSCLNCHRNAATRIAGSRADLAGPENCSSCHR